jgi:hypothetical protein
MAILCCVAKKASSTEHLCSEQIRLALSTEAETAEKRAWDADQWMGEAVKMNRRGCTAGEAG